MGTRGRGDALQGYTLVKQALDNVDKGGCRAWAGLRKLCGMTVRLKTRSEREGFEELASVVKSLKDPVPFTVGGHIALGACDRGTSLVVYDAEGHEQEVPGVLQRFNRRGAAPALHPGQVR
jgi:hypothetical protein